MKKQHQRTVLEFADNGIIIRYPDFEPEVCEQRKNQHIQWLIKQAYGSIVANMIECFTDEDKHQAIGYKISIDIKPCFGDKDLKLKRL